MQTFVIESHNRGKLREILLDHHRLRHEIFIERLGWNLEAQDGLEFDAYDTPQTCYIVVADDHGKARAVSRLVSTTQPYMIRDLWSDWYPGVPPHSERIWEASRFGCCPRLSLDERKATISQLYDAIYDHALKNNVAQLLMVMPVFIFERIIKPMGYDMSYVGPVRRFNRLPHRIGQVCISPEYGVPVPAVRSKVPVVASSTICA